MLVKCVFNHIRFLLLSLMPGLNSCSFLSDSFAPNKDYCLKLFLSQTHTLLSLALFSMSLSVFCSFCFLMLTFPLSMVLLQGCLGKHQLCGTLHYPAICRPVTLTPAALSNSRHSKPSLTPANPAQTLALPQLNLPVSNFTDI